MHSEREAKGRECTLSKHGACCPSEVINGDDLPISGSSGMGLIVAPPSLDIAVYGCCAYRRGVVHMAVEPANVVLDWQFKNVTEVSRVMRELIILNNK